jgi:hypothetical protein
MHVRVAIFQNIERFIRQPEAAGRSCRLPNGNGACALGNWSSPDRRSLGRTSRRGRTWLAHAVVGTPQAFAAHGQLRALSHSLRERISTRGHPPNRLTDNRHDAIENIVDADLVASLVRELIADRAQWTGIASDLLRAGWPKSRSALAGRLCRAQTFLRALGIQVTISREGSWKQGDQDP